MNLPILLGILLAISVAGNGLLAKLYVGAREDVAKVTQAFNSFKAQTKVEGEEAAKKAKAQEMSDKLRRDTANAENASTVARLTTSIAKLRRDRDGSRGRSLPPAPAASKRPDLLCLDRAEYQREDGILTERLLQGARGLADEGTTATVNLNTALKWATELRR